jgi:hypothetical protein
MCRAQQEAERAEARAAADSVEAAREEAAATREQLEERVAADLAGDAEAVQLQAKLKVNLRKLTLCCVIVACHHSVP